MNARIILAIPAAVSMALSLSTIGTHPFWQDSGVFLSAIREMGLVYAPGFIAYEVLCRLWSGLLFFIDFTLAVHLFSALCAALASGVLALAVRDLLRSRGPLFRVTSEDPGPLADYCGILAGVLMAGGYTLWFTAIYAKPYAFYYLVLCLLIWRMIRADDSGTPRDLTIVAALIGLAWQAHLSAGLAGLAILLFVGAKAKSVGGKGIAGRLGLAAAVGLGPSLLGIPILAAGHPWLLFGNPGSAGELARYAMGGRYVHMKGAFGPDASRIASFFRFGCEDLLGIGVGLTVLGILALLRRNPRLLVGILCWVLPFGTVAILFKNEVQHDCWFVAARLPLFLALGVGAYELLAKAGARGAVAAATLAVAGTAWSAVANYSDVNQRNYHVPELYGRMLLETPDRDAIVLLTGDDSNGLASYLQRVRGERPDLLLVASVFLNSEASSGSAWFEENLRRRSPGLKIPDYRSFRSLHPGAEFKPAAVAAFINTNSDAGRPIFSDLAVDPALLRPDLMLAPAGVYYKVVPRAAEMPIDLHYWKSPIEAEAVRPLYRRKRAQDLRETADGVLVRPQYFERRLAAQLLRARVRLAIAFAGQGRPAEAARLCQSVLDYDDEEFEKSPEIIRLLATSSYEAGDLGRADAAFRVLAELGGSPEQRAMALYHRGMIARQNGDETAAARFLADAKAVPGLDPAALRELERRAGSR
ncbi:MAG TPA: DUF2723 domain-containing protein [Planctomycetota bacterium]|nr:DUF2723 domain-containing protein [Planctomycetota bacterium]